jgi:hypothetical protein
MMFKLEKKQQSGGDWVVIGKSDSEMTIQRLFAWVSSREDVEAKIRVRDAETNVVMAVFCHSGLDDNEE